MNVVVLVCLLIKLLESGYFINLNGFCFEVVLWFCYIELCLFLNLICFLVGRIWI